MHYMKRVIYGMANNSTSVSSIIPYWVCYEVYLHCIDTGRSVKFTTNNPGKAVLLSDTQQYGIGHDVMFQLTPISNQHVQVEVAIDKVIKELTPTAAVQFILNY